MSFVKCKGTALQAEVATVLTDVAQIISFDGPGEEPETTEFDTLDNPDRGIPYEATGRSEGGTVDGELFLDPALASHKNLLDKLEAPAVEDYKVIYADTTEWAFEGIFTNLRPSVELSRGLQASFSIKVNKTPTYPA